ncbi:hypothetical protein D3C71_1856350 [compost metagenome]
MGAVMLVGITFEVGCAGQEGRTTYTGGAGDQCCYASHQQALVRIHPGCRHAGDRVVVVDKAVVHQLGRAFHESLVASTGSTVGVENNF